MIEVIFNAVRLVVSREFRDSAAAFVEQLKKTEEWQKDFCALKITIPRSSAEQAVFFRDLAAGKLNALLYHPSKVTAFSTSFTELVGNALEHGCRGLWPKVKLSIEITQSVASLAVYNSRWRRFDLDKQLTRSRADILANPGRRRGQGLVLVSKHADEFRQDGSRGVRAVFYRHVVEFDVRTIDDLTIISLNDSESLSSPAAGKRLLELASNYLTHNIILNFNVVTAASDDASGSTVREAMLQLKDLTGLGAKSLVVYMPFQLGISLPRELGASSWHEALGKVRRPDLIGQINDRGEPLSAL